MTIQLACGQRTTSLAPMSSPPTGYPKGPRSAGRKAVIEATAGSNRKTDSQAKIASDDSPLQQSMLAYTVEQKESFDAFMQNAWEENKRDLELAWVKQDK